ncbi:MAG: O-antigen ligase family protein [Lachnospiraceae bacterium]|nr:O-antigen ligase family protein [Lachnospiraceae bacterium]
MKLSLEKFNIFRMEKTKLDRLAWTFLIFAMACSDLVDYYYWCDIKRLGVWVMIGFYLYLRFDLYKKLLKPYMICGVLLGIACWVYFLKFNYFSFYIYFNYAMGPVLIVWLPILFDSVRQAVLNIRNKWHTGLSAAALFFYVMIFFMAVSPYELKYRYIVVAFFLIPFCVYDLTGAGFRKAMLEGMINGLCLGFLVTQLYSFLFVPYVDEERYRAYRLYCTCTGESYLMFYIGLYMKSLLLKAEGAKKWKRGVFYFLTVFDLALMYLAGGRSPVVAVVIITFLMQAICVARERADEKILKKSLRVVGSSALIGICSLLLFPLAYCCARYMPEILDRPDYIDSIYNRRYSVVTNFLGSHYQYDNEYAAYYEGKMIDLNAMTFAEVLTFNLGRIIPGASYIIPDYFYEKATQAKVDRYTQYLELGYTTQEDYDQYIYTLLHEDEILADWPGDVLDFLEIDEETKGESELNPYFINIYEISSTDLRVGIWTYAIRHLNLFGHRYGTFKFYEGYTYDLEINYLEHAHNIFLITGYNNGIFAMIAFIGMFVAALVSTFRSYLCTKNLEELLPALLIMSMVIFGMFERAFDFLYDNTFTTLILLCIVCLRNRTFRSVVEMQSEA